LKSNVTAFGSEEPVSAAPQENSRYLLVVVAATYLLIAALVMHSAIRAHQQFEEMHYQLADAAVARAKDYLDGRLRQWQLLADGLATSGDTQLMVGEQRADRVDSLVSRYPELLALNLTDAWQPPTWSEHQLSLVSRGTLDGVTRLQVVLDPAPLQKALAAMAPDGHLLMLLRERQGPDGHFGRVLAADVTAMGDWRILDVAAFGLWPWERLGDVAREVLILGLSLLLVILLTRLLVQQTRRLRQRTRELAEANHELEFRTLHDGLTSLPNLTLLQERIDQRISGYARRAQRFAVMLINLNDFDRVNQVLGYECGDQLLREVAQRLQRSLRQGDTVARMERDLFALLVDTADKTSADLFAAKVLALVEQPLELRETLLTVSASVGIAFFPDHGRSVPELMAAAEGAMLSARDAADREVAFAQDLPETGIDRLSLLTGFRRALEQRQLRMVFQPKLSVVLPQERSFEALVRWSHPLHGEVSPELFIPLLEQTRTIVDLTYWTIHESLATLRRLRQQGLTASAAVNLSARMLDEDGFPLWVQRALEDHGVAAEQLRFEITESAMIRDSERAIEVLLNIAAVGVGLSVDDFGVGHSSLAYISRLPVDELKIDKSFVRNMGKWESDRAIVRATIDLAHDLGLQVVAEGVESLEQATQLREMGCDKLQGYFISDPLAEQNLLEWWRRHGAQDAERLGSN